MKSSGLIVAVIILLASAAAEAGGCGRMVRGRHRRPVGQPMATAYHPPIYQSSPITSPRMAYAQPTAYAQPLAYAQPMTSPVAMPSPAPPVALEPAYTYASANQGQQSAYYYTYDNSGKLIVSQWVDYLLRGGRAEGMPRPPLPIVGAFRNRD